MDKIESKTIDALRFPCALLVVFIHVFSSIGGYNIGSRGLYDTTRVLISQGIARLAVPVFLLTAGYLFFQGLEVWEWGSYALKLKKRIRALFIPYILWNLISVIFCFTIILIKGGGYNDISVFLTERGGVLCFWNCGRFESSPLINVLGWEMWDRAFPIDYPLWFVRDLMILNILAPVIYFAVKGLSDR